MGEFGEGKRGGHGGSSGRWTVGVYVCVWGGCLDGYEWRVGLAIIVSEFLMCLDGWGAWDNGKK